ncbi:MAG: DedA family protein [Paludibacter sp.]
MSNEIILSISQHGYLAILLLVFLQEVGFPNPIPNEFVMIAAGYLAYLGVLNFPLIVISALVGDLAGSGLLYAAFYFFGQIILRRKPSWIKLPEKKINNIKMKIETSGQSGIFVGRLTPFIRGYVSVLCGLLQIPPKKYSLILIGTASIWSFFYVSIGYLIGPYWNLVTEGNSNLHLYLGLTTLAMLVVAILFFVVKRMIVRTPSPPVGGELSKY